MSKYLEFVLLEEKPKTKIILVMTKLDIRLGLIKWFAGWRQYAFFPENGVVFSVECLEDIQSYMKGLR